MIRRPPRSTLFPTRRSSDLWRGTSRAAAMFTFSAAAGEVSLPVFTSDRKSTRLNSSHSQNSHCPFFFFNDPATPEIYPLSYTTLFRSLARHFAGGRDVHLQRSGRRGIVAGVHIHRNQRTGGFNHHMALAQTHTRGQ